ncbi:hypothetical protein NKH24_33635 [Mesorhizobium sp. M1300]
MAIGAAPAKMRIGLRLVVHGRALQGRHDFLALLDRQADITVEQALVAFLNPNFSATDIAKRAFALVVHSITSLSPQQKRW